ncbi:MAG TPA: hypothetical protein VFH89_00250 [Sphingomicrobium sp.]|nr:hypothetical protein [Sphingomicrobium sp.]
MPALAEDERGLRITNLIGMVELSTGTVLHVRPKTQPGDDWIRSVLALLVGADPVDAAGERAAGLSQARPDLFEALAAIYAARLERALHRDGPILVMQRERRMSATLAGKLDVTAWSRRFLSHPTQFPIESNRLAADNDYSRALAFVADRFAIGARSLVTKARLARAAGLLRPGVAVPHSAPAGAELRRLPPQWAVYSPAWSIACAVLARRSLLGSERSHAGISIAIEPWPLLERLLVRSIKSGAAQAQRIGLAVAATGHRELRLLSSFGPGPHGHRSAEPDGMLFENGLALATFEAKYRDYDPDEGPLRHEIFQALSAARAAGAHTAVLVYPGSFPTARWMVDQSGPNPARLFAVGLEMFSYVPGGEMRRGEDLMELVTS